MNDPTASILASIDVDELYQSTQQEPISHIFSYRSSSGRLKGYQNGLDVQRFAVDIRKSPSIESESALAETIMASILERYDTYGPFHQYAKPFLVGPSQFSQTESTLLTTSGVTTNLFMRDVDRLMWLKYVGSEEKYVLAVVDFFHNERSPGVVAAQWMSFESSKKQQDVRPTDITSDLQTMIETFFVDGSSYAIESAANALNRRMADFTNENPVLPLMWIAQNLSVNRHPKIDENFISTAKENRKSLDMLATALIGHMGYVSPSDADQREKPVPVGKIDVPKLLLVLEKVVLRNGIATSNATISDGIALYDLSSEGTSEEEASGVSDYTIGRNTFGMCFTQSEDDVTSSEKDLHSDAPYDLSEDDLLT